jgi:hypothetical protein
VNACVSPFSSQFHYITIATAGLPFDHAFAQQPDSAAQKKDALQGILLNFFYKRNFFFCELPALQQVGPPLHRPPQRLFEPPAPYPRMVSG